MNAAIQELKQRARRLHRRAAAGDAAALERVGRGLASTLRPPVQRKHCLRALAIEHGFSGWPHALRVLRGELEQDFGTTLYPASCHGFFNRWFRRHDEASASREQLGGYLLAYRRQFLVVESAYIRALGLEPSAPEWDAIGCDWVAASDREARGRLYGELIAARPDR